MYKKIVRPLLFLFQPETIHKIVALVLKFFSYIPFCSQLTRKIFIIKNSKLQRKVFGITFNNPVGLAAGFDKDAELYNELSDFGFGFIELGTVTPLAQVGNPKPRCFRLKKDKALINRMGFNNKGIENFVNNLKKTKSNIIIGGNIGKNTATTNENSANDYIKCFIELFNFVDYFVVNVSCPNIKDLCKLQDKDKLSDILFTLQKINEHKPARKPILLKISPDLNNEQLDDIIDIVIKTKIDGVVATNTTTKRENLITKQEQIDKISNGGLSGKPIFERSLEVIEYLYKNSNAAFPIIGVGGINSAADALKMLNAGASLIQVYTGFIYEGPFIVKKINRALLKI